MSTLTRYEPLVRRSLLMIGLYLLPASIALSLSGQMTDPDLWTHLRTGQWIVENRSFPDLELFSLNPITESWVAYSWLYDVLVFGLHTVLSLNGQVLFALFMALAITFALYSLLRKLSNHTLLSAGLAALGVAAMSGMLYGRSAMFSYVFIIIELHALYHAVLWQRHKFLFTLPVIFALWANLHIQFVYGLFIYACFVAQVGLDYFKCSDSEQKQIHKRLLNRLVAVGGGCLAATLATPYPFGTYVTVLHYLQNSSVYSQVIQEFQAPDFRGIRSFAFLTLVLATTWVAGRKRVVKPFWLLLFGVAVIVGFRSARDIWFAVVTGLPLIALAYASPPTAKEQTRPSASLVMLGLLGGVMFLWIGRHDIREITLATRLAEHYPVEAVEFIKARNYPGPLHNYYNWGGFLLWHLPRHRVSIDGRAHVYSGDYIKHRVELWMAVSDDWKTDSELTTAGIVIGPKKLPLSRLLSCNPHFELVYQDEIASVFIPQK